MTTAPTEIPKESATAVRVTSTRSAKKALAKMPGLVKDIADALAAPPIEQQPASRQMIQLALTQIIDSPNNPRETVGDVADLAASIKSAGLLQPILVAPAAAYRAGNDQMPDPTDEGKFVLIAGHRRTAACRLLKMTHVDAVVQDDKVGVAARKAMIIENFQRVDLTPIEEARAFAELEELGVKQEDIGTEVGCSQSHISKRLSLLKLDTEVQAAVVSKEITLADAVTLTSLADTGRQVLAFKDMKANRHVDAKAAVERQKKQKKLDDAKAKSRAELKAAKVAEISNLRDLFGWDERAYVLSPADIKKHAGMDCLGGGIDPYEGSLKYYCKKKKKCSVYPAKKQSTVDPAEAARKADEKGKRDAAKSRAAHAQMLAAYPLTDKELLSLLLEEASGGNRDYEYSKAQAKALKWMVGNGWAVADTSPWSAPGVFAESEQHAAKLLRLYVVGTFVALREIKASSTNRTWRLEEAEYVRDLVARTAYDPTAWELKQIQKQPGIKDAMVWLRETPQASA